MFQTYFAFKVLQNLMKLDNQIRQAYNIHQYKTNYE